MRKLTIEEFIKKANIIHNNKYDYTKITDTNSRLNVTIICNEHGAFIQKVNNHLNGNGCPICSKKFSNLALFKERANKVHNHNYDYSKVVYNGCDTKVYIICKKFDHGIFTQTPHMHLQGRGCPKCKSSKGELEILNWLSSNNIKYHHEYRFKDCRNKLPLPFDFYLPDHNTCIEFDGEQHYKPKSFGSDKTYDTKVKNLHLTIEKDRIKNEYCLKNNIFLVRIRYNDLYNVDKILSNVLL